VREKITVVGDAGCAARLGEGDYADVVSDPDEISGSAVVVLFEGGDDVFAQIRRRAPNAVVVVVGASPQPACEATLFSRSRIVGVDGADDSVVDVVEAIVMDRRRVFTCTVRCEGERGIDGEFAAVPVLLGAGGIREIVEDA